MTTVSEASLPRRSEPSTVNTVPTLDLFDCLVDADEIINGADDWKKLSRQIVKAVTVDERNTSSPEFPSLNSIRELALTVPFRPEERVGLASQISDLLNQLIEKRLAGQPAVLRP